MAIALDGSNTANNVALVITTTLTTTQSNDVIYAVISTANAGAAGATFSGGLTGWTQYFVKAQSSTCAVMVYWTTAASPLSSQSIVATLGIAGEEPATMIVFGVSGANTTTPHDSNVSLPASLGKSGSTLTNAVTAVSTTNANDMIVQVTGLPNTSGGWTAGTVGANATTLVQSSASNCGVQYYIASSTQSSVTATSNWTTSRASISAVFGIQQATVAANTSDNFMMMGVGI